MGRRVKISRKSLGGHASYIMNVPKAMMELLGEPREVILSLEVRNGKHVIVMEPVLPEQGHQSKQDSSRLGR